MTQQHYEEIGTEGTTRPSYIKQRRNNTWVLYLAISLILVIGPIITFAWFLADGLDPREWTEDSVPYLESIEFAKENPRLQRHVGTNIEVEKLPETSVTFRLTEADNANIVLLVKGSKGRAEVHVQWNRPEDHWRITDAWYLTEEGETHQIPFRSGGQMLAPDDLAIYEQADKTTPFGRGVRMVLENRAVASLAEFRKAIDEDPENAQVFYWRGRAFEEVGNPKKAEKDYGRAVELDPEHARAAERLNALVAAAAAAG
jgi:tetratricopeptide (TPR) repeat protein